MSLYRVQIEYDVEADSPREAAETVWGWMRDPMSYQPYCDVLELVDDQPTDWSSAVGVDLAEEEVIHDRERQTDKSGDTTNGDRTQGSRRG